MIKTINQINALQVENKRLKAEIKMLTGWISLLSHNNTEILESLRWFIEAYENESLSEIDFFKLLPQVKKDVTKHLNTSKDTREWLRTQFGNFIPKQNVLIALDLFNKLKEEYTEALNKKNLSFKFKGDPTHEIISDKILLFYILSKIIHNAIKYSNTEQEIFLEVAQNENNHVLSIIDFGTGISEENLTSIYSFDSAVHEGTEGELGAGLSLKIARYFVYLLTGSIKLHSSDTGGTTVTIYLPLN